MQSANKKLIIQDITCNPWHRNRLCVAVWNDTEKAAQLIIQSGSACESVGFSTGGMLTGIATYALLPSISCNECCLTCVGKEYLYGEEALFLMEQGGM